MLMYEMLDDTMTLMKSIGVVVMVAFLLGEITISLSARWQRIVAVVVFSAGVAFAMADRLTIANSFVLDARHTLIGMSGYVAGPIAAMLTVLTASVYRVIIGGPGVVIGVIGIAFSGAIGVLMRRWSGRSVADLQVRDLLILAALLTFGTLSPALYSPMETARLMLLQTPVLLFTNVVGCLMLGLILRRLTFRLTMERRFRMAAMNDALTDLANRRALDRKLEELATDAEGKSRTALLVVDVDWFKDINDRLGHAGGDRVLVAVADVLRAEIREMDFAARFGGDEFVILLGDADDDVAHRVASRICDRARQIETGAPDLTVSVSIGVAVLGQDAKTSSGLLAAADAALYRSKRSGRSQVTTFAMAA